VILLLKGLLLLQIFNLTSMTNTLLLIVDVQNAIADKKPYLFDKVLSNIKTLLEKFRELKLPLIFIRHDDGIGSELEVNTHGWEIVKDISPLKGERVIAKRFNSAFRETSLEKELHDMQIQKLIVIGLQTEYCIDTTIRVAFEKGFTVIIPEATNTTIDGKFLKAKDIYEHHHHLFNNRFGTIAEMEQVLKELKE
jgi:nicotinamidase-related amidase